MKGKKMTALYSSVAADEGRPSMKAKTSIILFPPDCKSNSEGRRRMWQN